MIRRLHPAQIVSAGAPSAQGTEVEVQGAWYDPNVSGALIRLGAVLLVSLALSGCRHKTHWVPPTTSTAPVEIEPGPEPQAPPMIAEVSPPVFIPPVHAETPKKQPRKSKPKETPPPVQIAAADPALSLGSLSPGGDANPQALQQVRDLIVSIQKRVSALPHAIASQEKSALRQVSNFLKQAQVAVDSGDADGGSNLATKARLLMDDIEKR